MGEGECIRKLKKSLTYAENKRSLDLVGFNDYYLGEVQLRQMAC